MNTQYETDAEPPISFFSFLIVLSSSFFLKVLLLGILNYQEDSTFSPTDLPPNVMLSPETCLRADESHAAAEQLGAAGALSTEPAAGDRAGTGGAGH